MHRRFAAGICRILGISVFAIDGYIRAGAWNFMDFCRPEACCGSGGLLTSCDGCCAGCTADACCGSGGLFYGCCEGCTYRECVMGCNMKRLQKVCLTGAILFVGCKFCCGFPYCPVCHGESDERLDAARSKYTDCQTWSLECMLWRYCPCCWGCREEDDVGRFNTRGERTWKSEWLDPGLDSDSDSGEDNGRGVFVPISKNSNKYVLNM